MTGETPSEKRRIAALVGLCLLEVIRARDLPTEILGAENPAQTMPRRLGLSEAVELQIRRFKAEVRRRGRISDEEAKALFNLVIRRADSEAVFFQAGELLAGKEAVRRGGARWYPQRVRFALARRSFRKRLHSLFGRAVGGFAQGPFTLEASGHFLLEMDPGGDACALVAGFAQAIVSGYAGEPVTVLHSACVSRKNELCRWNLSNAGR